jgi:anti-sigma regulatory factor (Ser/Thr protein kinase)
MDRARFRHEALLYRGADEYLAGTLPYLQAALATGEPALVAAGPAQAELLARELGSAARRIRFEPIEEVGRNPASLIPLWRDFVEDGGGRSVRGICEPAWAERSPAALEECHRHEALLEPAFAGNASLSLLCPYDAASLPPETLARVEVSHRRVRHDGESKPSKSFDPDLDYFAGRLPPPRATPHSLPFGLGELNRVRAQVAAAAARTGLDPTGAADLVTAASELAANSVMHGGGTGVLRLWSEQGELLVEVEDRGLIEEPLVGRLRPSITQEGGRGLWLANQLCDLVQIRSGEGGTVIRLHLAAEQGWRGDGESEDAWLGAGSGS